MQTVEDILSTAIKQLKARRTEIDLALNRLEVRAKRRVIRSAAERKAISKRMKAYWAKRAKS